MTMNNIFMTFFSEASKTKIDVPTFEDYIFDYEQYLYDPMI